jgi:aldehyde dehydrogenase (NAD+)/succinate-semialdehyde dehydrogenase/glutarate-semialdehyde dehydrogenase
VELVEGMKLGTGLDFDAEMGSLTFKRQLDAVTRHVDQAVKEGATVLAGGKARPDVGPLVYEPTILADVTGDMDLCANETFGPVVSVYKYRDEDEVVARANDTEYGLVAYVFTRDHARVLRVSEALEFGMVGINTGIVSNPAAPFGGVKHSGFGREGGFEGIEEYLETKYVGSAL